MHTTVALIAALASAAYAQGVTETITPKTSAPEGCSASYSGKFEITAYNITATKRDLEKRTCGAEGSLTLELANGKLTDAKGRTGYIAANNQLQFDAPPQTGAIYTAGFSVCSNGSIALGDSAVFYQCKSGNPNGGESGAFYNLYDDQAFDICTPATINVLPCGAGSVGQKPDGQPTGASATAPVTQIGDGQIQGPSAVPAPISELSDGQPQVPTALATPVSQISDGQIQAPTGAPVSQISDGQVQVPTGAPISQISDGQIQAPTSVPATTAAGAPISQISDGQIQAPTGVSNATATSTYVPVSSGSLLSASLMTIVGAVVAVACL